MDVYAEVINDEVAGPIDYWIWNKPSSLYFSGSPVENDYDSTATFHSDTPGEYTVYAYGTDYYEQTDYDWAYVYVMDVEIDTPSSFPAYVALGENLSLGSTLTPASASGGTYAWAKVTGPGTVTFSPIASAEDPNFSADQAEDYTVKVEYAKGGATASDTSGTITVFDVEITDLQTTPYLVGSGNVAVSYTISPSGFTADSAVFEVRDKDGTLVHSDSNISKTGGPQTATWSGSTESLRSVHWNKDPYEVKITIAKDTASCSDTMNMTVIQSGALVFPEDSPNTSSPITDCMEGREVTFTSNGSGFISIGPSNPATFTFFFQHADGSPWSSPETDWSFDLIEDCTVEADDVLTGDTDHNFDTPIHVTVQDNFGHFATSNYVWIKVWELWIDYFRDHASGTADPWEVCVNRNITYGATSAPYCKSWNWDMADGVPDVWNPTGGNAKSGMGMVIPNSDMPSSNSRFGSTYGTVKVFCEDEEGNNHTFYSTNMNPSQKAKVFFERDATTSPGGTDQNWYFYWATDKQGPCQHKVSATTSYAGATITWDYNSSIPGTGRTTRYSATAYTIEVSDTTPDARPSPTWTFNSPRVPSVGTFIDSTGSPRSFPALNITLSFVKANWEGIDSVEQTLEHEKEHVLHWRNWEPPGGVWFAVYGVRTTGVGGNDRDADYLPNAFEDTFGTRWDVARTFAGFYLSGNDNEVLCEQQAGTPSLAGSNDWAYPGKQWH